MPSIRMAAVLAGFLVALMLAALAPEVSAQAAFEDSWGYWTAHREDRRLSREDAVAKYNYCPTGGCVLRLEGVSVRPYEARKGETLTMVTTVTILTPENVGIPLGITREVFYQGKSLGRTKNLDLRAKNGTWDQTANFTLPADAPPGRYSVSTKITTGYGMDEKTTEFVVK